MLLADATHAEYELFTFNRSFVVVLHNVSSATIATYNSNKVPPNRDPSSINSIF